MLYFGSCNGVFRQLDRRTGRVLWATEVGAGADQYFFHGDVLVTSDLIAAGGDVFAPPEVEGGVHAFDTFNGQERWMYSADRGVAEAVTGLGRSVFATTLKGDLVSLDLDSGAVRWKADVEAGTRPVVVGDRVFTAGGEALYAVQAETGSVAWKTSIAAPVVSILATEAALYVGTRNGSVHRVDTRDGEILSSLELDVKQGEEALPVVRALSIITPNSIGVLLSDKSFDHRALVSLDLSLDGVRWHVIADDRWSTDRVFAWRDTVVLGTPSGAAIAYCVTDGSAAWSQELGGGPVRAIGGSEDTLYVGTTKGSLFAVRPPHVRTGPAPGF